MEKEEEGSEREFVRCDEVGMDEISASDGRWPKIHLSSKVGR